VLGRTKSSGNTPTVVFPGVSHADRTAITAFRSETVDSNHLIFSEGARETV
jgi:hypothetical protein